VQIFTKSFPRCGVPDAYASFADYAAFVDLLERTGSIVESTQIWWSVRPHHTFGTVEVRICDGQTEMVESLAVAALMLACIAAFAADHDDGRPLPAHARGPIEENLWRAERHGLAGRLIDLDRGVERDTAAAVEALLEWSAPVHDALGLGPFLAAVPGMLSAGNGAMRQMARLAELGDVRAMHAEVVERTRRSAEEALEMATAAAA
jgi:carboxylate-amine ligase